MKKILFLFVFLFQLSHSQNVELRWAEKIKTKGQASVLGGTNNNFYTSHRDNDNHLVLRTYNKEMGLKNEQIVNFNLDEKKYTYTGAYFLKNKIVHFIEETRRKEDKIFLYAGTTDENLKTSDKLLVLDEGDTDMIKSYEGFGQRRISPDSTKILIYKEYQGKKKEPNKLFFKVYDSNLTNTLFDKVAELPIKAKNFSMENVSVDNLGNVYILAKVDKERAEREKDHSKYYYKLVVFGIKGEVKEFDFDYDTKDIESIDLIAGKNNTLICTGFLKTLGKGFLSSVKKTLISDEMFSVIIDCEKLTMSNSKKYELEGLYPEKMRGSEDYVPYKVREIYDKEDGGFVVVAEQYKVVVRTHTTQYGTYTTYIYYYCDIATIHINNKSEVVSVSKMPKYQLNTANPSIVSTYKNGYTYIIYEDLAKNINATNDKETKRNKGNSGSEDAVFLLTVAPSGEMKKEIIYTYRDTRIKPFIRSSKVVSPGKILLNANDQIGILTIK